MKRYSDNKIDISFPELILKTAFFKNNQLVLTSTHDLGKSIQEWTK